MKFAETSTCRSGQQCEICRHKQQGYFWRRMIARVYEVEGLDFVCPQGKPWIDNKPPAPVKAEVAMAPFEAGRIGDYRYMGSKLRENEAKIRGRLPIDAALSVALVEMVKAESEGGCVGCRRKRWLRSVTQAFEKSTEDQKKLVLSILSS
jgi:hypothetical protein